MATKKPTFIELTIVEIGVNAPSPRKGLVDIATISGLEDLGDKTPLKTRCLVTLHEASDTIASNIGGESVVRGNRKLQVRETYQALSELLAEHSVVIRPK